MIRVLAPLLLLVAMAACDGRPTPPHVVPPNTAQPAAPESGQHPPP